MFTMRSLALLAALLVLPNAILAQPKYTVEVYQDFRNKAPLKPEFRLEGRDSGAFATPEAEGFRITFPKAETEPRRLQVAPQFGISGDFEITGTYELLSADLPTDGWGVGVEITLADTPDLHKFLKIARLMRPKAGSVFMAEYFTKGANDWKGPQPRTKVMSGQLRLVREGTAVRCQVTDGADKEFTTIFEKPDFGAEDLPYLRYQVSTGSKPGYGVDARLIDLRIRHSPAVDAIVVEPAQPGPAAEPAGSRALLLLILGLGIMLMVGIALGLFFYLRSRHESEIPTKPGPGKRMKNLT